MAPDLSFYRSRLPHWEVSGGIYFVTLHLRGALPMEVMERIHRETLYLKKLKPDQQFVLKRKIFLELENWLHRAVGVSHLAKPEIAQIITESLEFRQKSGIWRIWEYVLMPNHSHLLFDLPQIERASPPGEPGMLFKIMERFKEWTGWRCNQVLDTPGSRFWQREWFDHWCRSMVEVADVREYIRQNPVKAGLVRDYRDWPFGSWNNPLFIDPL